MPDHQYSPSAGESIARIGIVNSSHAQLLIDVMERSSPEERLAIQLAFEAMGSFLQGRARRELLASELSEAEGDKVHASGLYGRSEAFNLSAQAIKRFGDSWTQNSLPQSEAKKEAASYRGLEALDEDTGIDIRRPRTDEENLDIIRASGLTSQDLAVMIKAKSTHTVQKWLDGKSSPRGILHKGTVQKAAIIISYLHEELGIDNQDIVDFLRLSLVWRDAPHEEVPVLKLIYSDPATVLHQAKLHFRKDKKSS